MFRWTTWWSRSRYRNPFSAHEKKTITTEVMNMSDWKQMSDCKVNRQQIKCELRAMIELLTLDRWVTWIQLHNPSAGSAMKPQSEIIPPRWPWKAHHFLLNWNSLVIASKPEQHLLHTTSSHYIWHVGPRHLISPPWRRRGWAGEKMKDSKEGEEGEVEGEQEYEYWILNATSLHLHTRVLCSGGYQWQEKLHGGHGCSNYFGPLCLFIMAPVWQSTSIVD